MIKLDMTEANITDDDQVAELLLKGFTVVDLLLAGYAKVNIEAAGVPEVEYEKAMATAFPNDHDSKSSTALIVSIVVGAAVLVVAVGLLLAKRGQTNDGNQPTSDKPRAVMNVLYDEGFAKVGHGTISNATYADLPGDNATYEDVAPSKQTHGTLGNETYAGLDATYEDVAPAKQTHGSLSNATYADFAGDFGESAYADMPVNQASNESTYDEMSAGDANGATSSDDDIEC